MQDQKIHNLLIQLEQAKNTIHYITTELKKNGINPEECSYKIQHQEINQTNADKTRSILLSRMEKFLKK